MHRRCNDGGDHTQLALPQHLLDEVVVGVPDDQDYTRLRLSQELNDPDHGVVGVPGVQHVSPRGLDSTCGGDRVHSRCHSGDDLLVE